MNKKSAQITAVVGIFFIVLGLFLFVSPLKLPIEDRMDLDAYQGISRTTPRTKGERVEGYFSVLGGDKVDFYVQNPYGVKIYDVGTVTGRADYVYAAEVDGVYTEFFGNRDNYGKTIFLTEQRNVTAGVDLAFIGIGVALTILGLVVFYENKLKQAKQLPPQPNP